MSFEGLPVNGRPFSFLRGAVAALVWAAPFRTRDGTERLFCNIFFRNRNRILKRF
jgi:hypothetical protein